MNSDQQKPKIATICSHSALQIFYGAQQEGFETIGICPPDREELYKSFPRARPDELVIMEDFKQLLESRVQSNLIDKNAVMIPHGSFVEYVGAQNLRDRFEVPIFGNKDSLAWESNREKEREWLKKAGINVPREYTDPAEIDGLSIVKMSGAKGGEGFFLVESEEEFRDEIGDKQGYTIQEFIQGTRYYPHYFYSPLEDNLEILGIDRRDESNVDEFYRGDKGNKSFVVVGNKPLAIRESLLPKIYEMGKNLVKKSQELFYPGLFGPFCLETICKDNLEIVAFEISGRIVAGTNLYPEGSPYSPYYYQEGMSTGRRIAREIKNAWKKEKLEEVAS